MNLKEEICQFRSICQVIVCKRFLWKVRHTMINFHHHISHSIVYEGCAGEVFTPNALALRGYVNELNNSYVKAYGGVRNPTSEFMGIS